MSELCFNLWNVNVRYVWGKNCKQFLLYLIKTCPEVVRLFEVKRYMNLEYS